MIISLVFAIINFYLAFDSFRNKRWGWCAFSTVLGGFCAWQVATAIL